MREQTPGNDGRVRRHIVRIERARLVALGINPGGIEEEQWKTQCATTSSDSTTSCVSATASHETPGYCVVDSPGSMRKQKFIVGNGHKIPNKGQVHLNLEADGSSGASAIGAIFQVAAITRPLMSVCKL